MNSTPVFWSPEFDYEHRSDGTILMRARGDLPAYLPTLADYLDKWADETPDQPWLARRDATGAWDKIDFRAGREQAQAIGAALLSMGLGPDRPLLILSGNSLEHALLGAACMYVGIPFAPVSPAYSLVSKDHAKLKTIAELLQPGAAFADDAAAFAPAFATLAPYGVRPIALSRTETTTGYETLLAGDPALARQARAEIGSETVVKYLFTSGSTGTPKAVINTNDMISANQAMIRDCYRFLQSQPPVVLDWAPWNHTAGGNKVFYPALFTRVC